VFRGRFRGWAKAGAGATVERTASLGAAASIRDRAPLDRPSSYRPHWWIPPNAAV